jgi:hypothetical protein
MSDDRPILFEYTGTYGGAASRDEIVRALKEALALVESTPKDAELACPGIRLDLIHPGRPRG